MKPWWWLWCDCTPAHHELSAVLIHSILLYWHVCLYASSMYIPCVCNELSKCTQFTVAVAVVLYQLLVTWSVVLCQLLVTWSVVQLLVWLPWQIPYNKQNRSCDQQLIQYNRSCDQQLAQYNRSCDQQLVQYNSNSYSELGALAELIANTWYIHAASIQAYMSVQ